MRYFILGFDIILNWFILYFLSSLVQNLTGHSVSLPLSAALATALLGSVSLYALSPYGSWLLRLKSGLKPLPRDDARYLLPLFEEVYDRSGVKGPIRIMLKVSNSPNAFVLGPHIIGVTTGLLRTATPGEIKGILAHELGHIIKHAQIVAAAGIVSMTGNVALAAAVIIALVFSGISQVFGPMFLPILVLKGVQLLLNLVFELYFLPCRRNMEIEADNYASSLGYRVGLLSYLSRIGDCEITKLDEFFSTNPMDTRYRKP